MPLDHPCFEGHGDDTTGNTVLVCVCAVHSCLFLLNCTGGFFLDRGLLSSLWHAGGEWRAEPNGQDQLLFTPSTPTGGRKSMGKGELFLWVWRGTGNPRKSFNGPSHDAFQELLSWVQVPKKDCLVRWHSQSSA